MSYRSYSQRDEGSRGRIGGVGGGSSNSGGGGYGSGGGGNSGGHGSGNSTGEDTPPMSRLFVICNKANTEQEIRDAFEKFGDIEDVWVVQNKQTGENKGTCACLWTGGMRVRGGSRRFDHFVLCIQEQ